MKIPAENITESAGEVTLAGNGICSPLPPYTGICRHTLEHKPTRTYKVDRHERL